MRARALPGHVWQCRQTSRKPARLGRKAFPSGKYMRDPHRAWPETQLRPARDKRLLRVVSRAPAGAAIRDRWEGGADKLEGKNQPAAMSIAPGDRARVFGQRKRSIPCLSR